MTETTRPPDTSPAAATTPEPKTISSEILKEESYGLYGRLLLAIQLPDKAKGTLNPDEQVTIFPAFDPNLDKDYNPITNNLSAEERRKAWGNTPFEVALRDWKSKFKGAINSTAIEERKTVVRLISGKEASDFSEEDAGSLYETYCRGKSDITAFTHAIVEKLKDGGTVNGKNMNELMPQIQWLASKFFGDQTASVVSKIVELDASLSNDRDTTVKTVYDRDRMNKLNKDEIDLLRPIYEEIKKAPKPTPSPAPELTPAPIETEEEKAGIPVIPPTPGPEPTDESRLKEEAKIRTRIAEDERLSRERTERDDMRRNNLGLTAQPVTPMPGTIPIAAAPEPIPSTTEPLIAHFRPGEEDNVAAAPISPEPPATSAPAPAALAPKPAIPSPAPAPEAEPQGPPAELSDLEEPSEERTTQPQANIITLESRPEDFISELGGALSADKNLSKLTVNVPVETLRGYFISSATSDDVQLLDPGTARVAQGDVIEVQGLRIHASKYGLNKDLTLNLSLVNSGNSIQANIINIEGLGRIAPGKTRKIVEEELANLTASFRKRLKKTIEADNPDWQPDDVNIAGERILIGFHNTSVAARDSVSEPVQPDPFKDTPPQVPDDSSSEA